MPWTELVIGVEGGPVTEKEEVSSLSAQAGMGIPRYGTFLWSLRALW
jgi:hypothetical protein